MEAGKGMALRILNAMDHGVRRVLLWFVGLYRRYLSFALGGHCRFVPSCSCYAEEALQVKRSHRAVGLILWRIGRCQPFCRSGLDPVPVCERTDDPLPMGAGTKDSPQKG